MNLIIVPFHDYKKWLTEGFRTRDAHLCQHFAASEQVEKLLVVNRPVSLAEVCGRRMSWKTPGGEELYCEHGVRLAKMSDKVFCIDFFLPDLLRVAVQRKAWWFTAFREPKIIDAINRAAEFLGMTDSILLLQNPMAIGAAQSVHKRGFVFDAIDNWLYHPQMKDKALIRRNYDYVTARADLILTVSQALADFFRKNGNTHWISNGVDAEFFAPARKPACGKTRVVGYVGKIQDRVDFDLAERCLQAHPDWEFRFLGPVYSQQQRIDALKQRYPNIRFTGDIPYSRLPEAMRDFDIAIIPHRVDAFTESMNPLKLYEYLAAGKPVVTMDVAGTSSISPYVLIAQTPGDFLRQLDRAAALTASPDQIAASIPAEYTWQNRTAEILRLMSGMTANACTSFAVNGGGVPGGRF